ncbi:hypothetical protein ACIQU5_12650 [Streptomyces sp. NPDC090306]|uniref:hypothetical protein n=1 Tax=Streptomyces sp. NPDC090306 TaxID=3365961 RepID=UPI0038282342
MGVVPDWVFVLPAVILVGWIPTWWGSRRLRWTVLATAAVVCGFFVVVGWQSTGPPPDPQTLHCSPLFACMDYSSVYVLASGLLGFLCWMLLTVLTLVGEVVVHVRRRRAA